MSSKGATYIYRTHLAPFLTQYEPTIDAYLSQYKRKLYEYLQAQFRILWKHISALIAEHTGINLNNVDPQASPNTEAAQGLAGSNTAGGAADGLGHGARVALGLWRTWGPTVVNALKPIRDAQQDSPSMLFAPAGTAGQAQASAPSSGFADTTSVLARRRQLEAELAALNALHPTSFGSPNLPTIPTPSSGTGGSSDHPSPSLASANLYQSQYLAEPDTRTIRDGKYEEIGRDEIDDSEHEEDGPQPPTSPAAGWWPAWGRRSSGYERVKTD